MDEQPKTLQIDDFEFTAYPGCSIGEQINVWRDDSRILQQAINALLDHAPEFCQWLANEYQAREQDMKAEEAENGKKAQATKANDPDL